MANILLMAFMKRFYEEFCISIPISVNISICDSVAINQYWFRYCLCTKQTTSHYQYQWSETHWCPYDVTVMCQNSLTFPHVSKQHFPIRVYIIPDMWHSTIYLLSISGHIILHQKRYTDSGTCYLPHSLQRELVSNWTQTGNEVSPDWNMTWGTLGCRTSPTRALRDKGHPGYHHWSYWRWSVSPLQKWNGSHHESSFYSKWNIFSSWVKFIDYHFKPGQPDPHLIKTDMPCTVHVNCPEMCIVWPNPALIFNSMIV